MMADGHSFFKFKSSFGPSDTQTSSETIYYLFFSTKIIFNNE